MKYLIITLWIMSAGGAIGCTAASPTDLARHVNAVNALRVPAGLPPVAVSTGLNRIAQEHACDMSRHKYFGHNSPDGRGLPHRIATVRGPETCRAAENIARGHTNIDAVMRGWMRSRGHRDNILNPKLTHVGLGHAQGAHWVQVFGGPC